jgi:hypothetical protein
MCKRRQPFTCTHSHVWPQRCCPLTHATARFYPDRRRARGVSACARFASPSRQACVLNFVVYTARISGGRRRHVWRCESALETGQATASRGGIRDADARKQLEEESDPASRWTWNATWNIGWQTDLLPFCRLQNGILQSRPKVILT